MIVKYSEGIGTDVCQFMGGPTTPFISAPSIDLYMTPQISKYHDVEGMN